MANISDTIKAKDCVFQIKMGDEYQTVFCSKSAIISIATVTKETTTRGDGKYKSFDYEALEYTVSFEKVSAKQNNVDPTTFDFAWFQDNFVEVDFRIIYKNSSSSVAKVFRGQTIVSSLNINANFGQYVDSTAQLKGSGKYYMEDAVPEFVNLQLKMTGNDTAAAFGRFKLLNGDGDVIFDSGQLPQAIGNGSLLTNPFDLTVPVPKGNWYVEWQCNTETLNNNLTLNAPPTLNQNFSSGNNNFSSYPHTTYDFNSNRIATWTLGTISPPPTCVAVQFATPTTIPNGTVGTSYSYFIQLSGSAPFTLSDVTKPAWMNIQLTEINSTWFVWLSGTPDATGTDIAVIFTVKNCTLTGSVTLNETIDIAANPNNVTFNWSHFVDTGGNLTVFVNSVVVVSASTTSSGSFTANAGDVVEAQVTGSPEQNCFLEISNNIQGVIFSDSALEIIVHSFTVLSGRTYEITSEVTV